MKKCPFRKEYIRDEYNLYGEGFPVFNYIEKFQECIGKECMAYTLDYTKTYWENEVEKATPICLIMKGNNNG